MKFCYERPDGGLSIVIAAPKSALEKVLGPLTDDQYETEVWTRTLPSLPEGVKEMQRLPDSWSPPDDRTFRDAWKLDGESIAVDMTKARDIHRNALRRQRVTALASLDVEQMRAIEIDDKAALASVAGKKQKLRDAPAHPSIEKASTPDELKSITLDTIS